MRSDTWHGGLLVAPPEKSRGRPAEPRPRWWQDYELLDWALLAARLVVVAAVLAISWVINATDSQVVASTLVDLGPVWLSAILIGILALAYAVYVLFGPWGNVLAAAVTVIPAAIKLFVLGG